MEMVTTGRTRFMALALITILLAISSADRAALSIAAPGMSEQIGLRSDQLGWLFSAFAWTYVAAQVPAGWVLDYFGVKWTIFFSVLVWSLAVSCMGAVGLIASPFIAVLLLRMCLGLFESPVGPAAARVISSWFPTGERGIAGTIFASAQYISLAVFIPFMGFLDYRFGWEAIFPVMGGLGILFSLVWAALYYPVGKHPRLTRRELEYIRQGGGLVEPLRSRPSLWNVTQLFRSRMLLGIFGAQYCITAITWFFITWFPSYLVTERGFTVLDASIAGALPALAGFSGGLISGYASDWLLRRTGSLTVARKIPITIGLALSAVMIGCNYTESNAIVLLLMTVAFFGKGCGALTWSIIADTAPEGSVGLTAGVFNAIGNIAGIITPLTIGLILATTHSFNGAILFVGLHGLTAILFYWVMVGPIKRAGAPNEVIEKKDPGVP